MRFLKENNQSSNLEIRTVLNYAGKEVESIIFNNHPYSIEEVTMDWVDSHEDLEDADEEEILMDIEEALQTDYEETSKFIERSTPQDLIETYKAFYLEEECITSFRVPSTNWTYGIYKLVDATFGKERLYAITKKQGQYNAPYLLRKTTLDNANKIYSEYKEIIASLIREKHKNERASKELIMNIKKSLDELNKIEGSKIE